MKRAIILPVLMALAACSDSPEESLTKAQQAFARHDYPAARLHLEALLAQRPEDAGAQLLQARTLLSLGDGHAAQAMLDRLGPGAKVPQDIAELRAEAALLRGAGDAVLKELEGRQTPEAERLRAMVALTAGKLADAATHFEAGEKLGGNARLFADHARLALVTGDVDKAEALLAKARKLAPDGIDTLLVGGEVAVRRGDLKTALDSFGRAVSLYPASLPALTGKAAVLGDLGRTKEMRAVLDKATAFAPRNTTVVYLRAKAAADAKDWKAVRAAVQPEESNLPALHPVRVVYAEALLRLGQHELAIAQAQPIVRAQPGAILAARVLAEAQLATGDARAAMATLAPAANRPDARPEDLALMAKAAKLAGSPDAAAWQQRAQAPAVPALASDLAAANGAIGRKDWAAAIAAYDRALAGGAGENPLVLNNLAYAQLMVGNLPRARDLAERALRLAPDDASVLDTAGWISFKSGDVANAKRLLRTAAQKAPENVTIRQHLTEAERAPG